MHERNERGGLRAATLAARLGWRRERKQRGSRTSTALSHFAPVYRISEPPTSDIRQTDRCSWPAEQTMNRKFNLPVALAFTVLGALPWPAAAQAPPRNHDTSSIWSSQDRSLHEIDLLTPRAFGELI